jgi:hypothetical protein
MSDLTDFMRSAEYIKIYTGMESSGPQKGIIHTEDASDRLFWKQVVNEVCPGKYDIKPFSQGGEAGKRRLEQQYRHLHKHYLIAVDSDYDFLCPDRNEFSAELNANPFILHTFCYSRESFIHTTESVEELTDCIHLHEKTHSQIKEALQRFSVTVYDALLVFSWLHNQDQQRFKESDFNQCFKLPHGVLILDDNIEVNEAAFKSLSQSVERYSEEYAALITDQDSFNHHETLLRSKGITPESALLFINGHHLLDGIFRPVYEKLIRKSRTTDNEWVVNHYPDSEVQSRKNQVRNHYEESCRPRQLINRCESYKTSPFWHRITQKLTVVEHAT